MWVLSDDAAELRGVDVKARLSRLLDLSEKVSAVGYWRTAIADRATQWSDEVFRIHGVDRAAFELTRESIFSVYAPEDVRCLSRAIAEVVSGRGELHWEGALRRPDGERREVVIRGCCEVDEGNAILGLFGLIQDVTEKKRAEAAQRASLDRLSRIIERLPAGAVLVQGGTLSVNAEIERMTGYSREELCTPKAWFSLLAGDVDGSKLQRYYERRARGFPDVVTSVIRRRDGQARLIEYRACQDEDGEIWILQDVTERDANQTELLEAKERAEVAAKSKSQFLANPHPAHGDYRLFRTFSQPGRSAGQGAPLGLAHRGRQQGAARHRQ
jgi:PAS domain S-box-containing protein